MKIRVLLASLVVLTFCVTMVLAGGDISGRWETEFSTVNGPERYFYELKVEGDKITGKSNGRAGDLRPEAVLKEGKIKGNDVSWVETLKDADGKEFKVETKGKIKGEQILVVRSPSNADAVDAKLTRVKPPSDLAKGITGTWKTEFESPIGTQKYTYELKYEAGKITGKCTGEAGDDKRDTTISSSDVRGDEISLLELADFGDTPIRVETEGKFLSADEIVASRRFGPYGPYDITLKRIKTK